MNDALHVVCRAFTAKREVALVGRHNWIDVGESVLPLNQASQSAAEVSSAYALLVQATVRGV